MVAAGAWLLGTLAVHELPALPGARWAVPLVLVCLVVLRDRRAWPLLWFAGACAWTIATAGPRLAERLEPARAGDVSVAGWVDTFPTRSPGQATFGFAVAQPRAPGVPPRLRLTWYDAPPALAAGDALRLTVRLRPPHGARNPRGFDYEQWLLRNDYGATGYVRAVAGNAAPPSSLPARWLGFRAKLAARIEAAVRDADGAALLVALALGERYRFTEQHWADFRHTGTSHLVAVSGMHIALLGVIAFAVVRRSWLWLPMPLAAFDLEVGAAASVLVTAYYAALTGFAVPAQRSFVMIVVALAVLVSRRRVGASQILAATLLAVLIWDPFAPLSASFWLSFSAVAILLALAATRGLPAAPGTPLQRGLGAVRGFASLQWSIGLALLPLTAWCFGEVSALGPVVNLVAIPLFSLVLVPLTVLASVALSFESLSGIAAPAVGLLGQLASATVAGLHAAAALRGAALPVPLPPWPAFALAAFGVAAAVAGRGLPGRRLAWLAVLPMLVPALSLPRAGEARAVVLDVGQGLAVLVETRGHRLLFDAGPAFRSGFDSGADIVLPALAAEGRRDLDLLIVSHADNDHAGGAPAVAAAFPAAGILQGPDVALARGRACARGQSWRWDGVEFRILHPSADFGPRGNESSCVLEVTAAGRKLLIAGDIERRGEQALLESSLGTADVVVVPHHGSATSSSPALVAALHAEFAIVSAGFANRWGFPKPEVVARWRQSGAAVVVTSESGAVSIELATHAVTIGSERDGRHRYWQAPSKPAS